MWARSKLDMRRMSRAAVLRMSFVPTKESDESDERAEIECCRHADLRQDRFIRSAKSRMAPPMIETAVDCAASMLEEGARVGPLGEQRTRSSHGEAAPAR